MTRRVIAFVSIVAAFLGSLEAFSQKRPSGPPAHVRVSQQIVLLFAGMSARDRVLLTLNNNRPESLPVELTLFTLEGHEVGLPSLTMNGSESRLIDFSGALQSATQYSKVGYLRINYSGQLAELGAQLTLYPSASSGGFDSPRSLSADFLSSDRHAVAWLPHGATATIALTNTSSRDIGLALSLSGRSERITLGANETVLREVGSPTPLVAEGVTLSCDVSYDGPIDAIRAFGYVTIPASGNLPVRFYDTATSTMPDLSAVGLDSSRVTHITVRNLGVRTVSVEPQLKEVGSNTPSTATGKRFALFPGQAKDVDVSRQLRDLNQRGIARGTLTLKTDSSTGFLIGAATQEVSDGLLEDVPLRTSNPPLYMRGFYPLRWDTDYTNAPMVANVSSETMRVQAMVKGSTFTYVLPIQSVPPGTTQAFDVDALRRNQVPDINGVLIPLTATTAKFHWMPVMPVRHPGLIGRTELLSLSEKRASSFSCGGNCSPYVAVQGPYWYTELWGSYQHPFVTNARISDWYEVDYDEYGTGYQYPRGTGWTLDNLSSQDSSIVSVGSSSSPIGDTISTGTPGATNLTYKFYNYVGIIEQDDSCELTDNGGNEWNPVTTAPDLNITGVKNLAVGTEDQPSNVTSHDVTASGYPSGGIYQWVVNNSNLTLINPSNPTVTMKAANAGSSTVEATYVLNGQSTTAIIPIKIYQPSSLAIKSDTGVTLTRTCSYSGGSYNGPERSVVYTIKDVSNATIDAPVYLAETFNPIANSAGVASCNGTPATSNPVSESEFTDNFNWCSSVCLPVVNSQPQGSCTSKFTHIWTANGFTVFNQTATYSCTNITPQ